MQKPISINENWKTAPGVKSEGQTNSGLAPRDYKVPCDANKSITIVEGYHLWWCTAHHQPLAWCDHDRTKEKLKEATAKLNKINQLLDSEE